MKILLCTPMGKGGVSAFYDAVRTRLTGDIDLLTIGARDSRRGPVWTTIRLFNDTVAFARLLKRNSYDIVHLNPSLDPRAVVRDGILLFIASRHKATVIVFFHGWTKSFEAHLSKYFLRPFKWLYSQAAIILVLCSEFKDALVQMGFPDAVRVVTTAVADDVFSPSIDEALSSKYANRREGFEILFLARIERSKGIYEALEAYRIVSHSSPDVRLVIAGDGRELKNVKRFVVANRISGVRFIGYVTGRSKVDAFVAADVFLLPTYYGEGMPLALLEAMAFGVPVVSRPVGGIKDFFEQGKMGFLCDSLNPEEFANRLQNLINNPILRQNVSAFNREYAKSHFAASKVARDLSVIYEEAIEASHRKHPTEKRP